MFKTIILGTTAKKTVITANKDKLRERQIIQNKRLKINLVINLRLYYTQIP